MEVFFMIYFFESSNNTFVNWLISKLAYIFFWLSYKDVVPLSNQIQGMKKGS